MAAPPLSPPPTGDTVRLIPLGGLGDIGMNCMVIEQGGDLLVVDCGISFPHDDLGLDVLHPDFSYLLERAAAVRGVVLTHGHEDHIGAIPYLMQDLDVPVYGPPHALGLVRNRLLEHGFDDGEVDLRAVHAGDVLRVGPFEVEPIRVAHSIVEATALRIETCAGTVVHSGDFNFDPNPPDGEPTNEKRLAEIGDRGVALLLSDSTNVDVETKQGSEVEVGETLQRLVEDAPHRVFVALFASNIQRLISLGQVAQRTGRKICLLGRSLRNHVEVGLDVGRLGWPSDLLVPPELARSMPRRNVLVLAGGTQGEKNSALARLAAGTHPDLELSPGDTVVMSSRVIPGNERLVITMMNDLLRRGAELATRFTAASVHTSGHATRHEQRRMLELLRPRAFLPVHGTLHHLRRHAELARSTGVEHVLVVENGACVALGQGGLSLEGHVPAGVIPIALGGEPALPETLRQRAEAARFGAATLSLAIDRSGRLTGGPELSTCGVAGLSSDGSDARGVVLEVARLVERKGRRRPEGVLRDELRRLVRRELERISGVRPRVDVHLLVQE